MDQKQTVTSPQPGGLADLVRASRMARQKKAVKRARKTGRKRR